MSDKTINIDTMLAKREEELGSTDRFPFIAKGETWQAVDPSLADDDWQNDLDDLRADLEDDELTTSEFRDALIGLYLGDEQAERFREAGCEFRHLNAALEIYAEQKADPTRRSSRSTRRRSKRR